MDNTNPPPPGDDEGMPSGQNEIRHLFHGGHSYDNSYSAVRPPQYWRPPPLPHPPFLGFAPRPYTLPPGHPFSCVPPVFSVPPPPQPRPQPTFRDKPGVSHIASEDKTWLAAWLQSRTFQQCSNTPTQKAVSIAEAQDKMKLWVHLLKGLEDYHSTLFEGLQTLSEEEWSAVWAKVDEGKSGISELRNSCFSEKSVIDLKKKQLKRVKKRSRLKRHHAEQREEVYIAQLRRQTLHKKADSWLSEMQLAVDRARKDDQLKKEADSVLSEVTKRQSDGRRQIALIEALQKLHQARNQEMEARGTKLSAEEKEISGHSKVVFGRLLESWAKKMDEYAKEEQSLRIMLEESAAKQCDLEIQNVQCILSEWEKCLFGFEGNITHDEPQDISTLVSIRYAWDQYLVPDGATVPMASTIPVGWVLPTTPSSLEWQKLLHKT